MPSTQSARLVSPACPAGDCRYMYRNGCTNRQTSFTSGMDISLVLYCYTGIRKFEAGNPLSGALNTKGWESFFVIFDRNRHSSRKRYEIGPWLLGITDRKSQLPDQSVLYSERRGRISSFLVDLHTYSHAVWPTATKFSMLTHRRGQDVFTYKGSAMPITNGAGHSVPQIFGTSYTRTHGMRNSNQTLYGDHTTWEENFKGSTTPLLAVWCSGNALVWINAVALHRARLVLGWVTAFGQVNCLIT